MEYPSILKHLRIWGCIIQERKSALKCVC
jgi:hypothetical protein